MKELPVKQALEFSAKTMWNNAATILLGSLFWFVPLIVSVFGVLLIGGGITALLVYLTRSNTALLNHYSIIEFIRQPFEIISAAGGIIGSLGVIATALALLFVFNALRLGFIKFLMQFDEHHQGSIDTMFSCFNGITVRYTIAAFLKWAAVFVGLLCFILPGIYLWIKFRFYTYSMLDRNTGSVASLQNSYQITKGFFFTLFITALLMGLFSYLLNSFVIIIFITAPFIGLVNIYLYRFLRDENR